MVVRLPIRIVLFIRAFRDGNDAYGPLLFRRGGAILATLITNVR